jgi:hypothetical protein
MPSVFVADLGLCYASGLRRDLIQRYCIYITPNRNQLPDSRAFSCAQARLKPVRKISGPSLGFACVWLWADRAGRPSRPVSGLAGANVANGGPLVMAWTHCCWFLATKS